MTCLVVIPVKSAGNGKTRLAGALDPCSRQFLVRAMLSRVIEAARNAGGVDAVAVLSEVGDDVARDVKRVPDPGGGLNHALTAVLRSAFNSGVSRMVIIPADLPLITRLDVSRLANIDGPVTAIAPDHHGMGTNALSLPLPQAQGFAFSFGLDSFSRHMSEAARHGLEMSVFLSTGLSRDVDVADDLHLVGDLLDLMRAASRTEDKAIGAPAALSPREPP